MVIRKNFWNTSDSTALYAPNLSHQLNTAPADYWFLGFNPSRIYKHFDLQANSLALLLGMGNELQDEIAALHLSDDSLESFKAILPSFYPSIEYD